MWSYAGTLWTYPVHWGPAYAVALHMSLPESEFMDFFSFVYKELEKKDKQNLMRKRRKL